MSEPVVRSIPGSPYGRAVLMALEEKGARYRLLPVAPQQLRSPAHLQHHPFGRVPVLEHGEFRLFETQAILRYLERVLPQPSLSPSEPCALARMDQLMNVNDWYLFNGVGNVIAFQRVVAPRLMRRLPDEAAIAAALPRAQQVLSVLAAALGSQGFFTGETLTLADLLLAPQLDMLAQTPEWPALCAPHPLLGSWLARMQARPSMVATTWERVQAMAS
jgi:glutathione S-transferase